jgi:hypothetical protein
MAAVLAAGDAYAFARRVAPYVHWSGLLPGDAHVRGRHNARRTVEGGPVWVVIKRAEGGHASGRPTCLGLGEGVDLGVRRLMPSDEVKSRLVPR